jgi:hypothetical protein
MLRRVLYNASGRVPTLTADRVPPSRVLLITEHDNVRWCNAVSLVHFFLNLADTALKYGNGGIAVFQRYIITVPMKVISAGMNCNVLGCVSVQMAQSQETRSRAHRGDRFVFGNLKDDPQVTIGDTLKPL